MKYSNINNIYMMVHKNYKNGKITEDQWNLFLKFYKEEFKKLDLVDECDLSIDKSEL
jgi:hypothetical protein